MLPVLTGVCAIAGAAEGRQNSAAVRLRIMGLPKPTDVGVSAQIDRAVVRAFSEEYPQYRLEPFHILSIKGGMDEGPLRAIATGIPPHGLYVNFRQSSTYINHGFLQPMEYLLARMKSQNGDVRRVGADGAWVADPTEAEVAVALEELHARVLSPVWPVIYRTPSDDRAGIPTGKHVWALPTRTLVRALLYRKDVFKEAGLDPERPPQDWREFLEYCRRIKELPNKYGFFYARGPDVSWSIYNFMVSNGVRYMAETEDGVWRASFNTMDAAESIYYLLRLTRGAFTGLNGEDFSGATYAPMGSGEVNVKWDQGDIGMRSTYLSFDTIQEINPALTGIAAMPKNDRGERGTELNCAMLGVFSGCTPEEQLGVMRYIWFYSSRRAREIRTKIYVDYGYGQFLDPRDLEEFGYDDILRKVPKSWIEATEECFRSGVPEPYGKNTQQIYLKVSVPINWALNHPELLELPRATALERIKEQLDHAAGRVDRFMLGKLTPKEWTQRRLYGGGVLVAIVLLFAGSLGYVWRRFGQEEKVYAEKVPVRRFLHAYLLILPGLALVLFVKYLPLILGTPLALFDYQFVAHTTFVGIDNFATVLYDQRFWSSLVRTFYYVALVVGLGFWPPVLVAILLDEVPGDWCKYFFRTIFYLPTIVSGVIMVFLWRQLYEPSEAGYLNQIIMSVNSLGPVPAVLVRFLALGCWLALVGFVLACAIKLRELSWQVRSAVGAFALCLLGATLYPLVSAYIGPDALVIEAKGLNVAEVSGWQGLCSYIASFFGPFQLKPIGWVEDPGLAMLCTVIPMVWATAGPGCIIYLAALKTVPEDLVEAATIDGAGLIQKLSYITLPRIKLLLLIQLMGAIVGAFRGGTNFILALTGGGPNGATRTLGMDIFERSFLELKFGIACSMGWILGALVILITSYQLLRMSRAQFKTAEVSETGASAHRK